MEKLQFKTDDIFLINYTQLKRECSLTIVEGSKSATPVFIQFNVMDKLSKKEQITALQKEVDSLKIKNDTLWKLIDKLYEMLRLYFQAREDEKELIESKKELEKFRRGRTL